MSSPYGIIKAVSQSKWDLSETFVSKARQVLPPIARELVEALDLAEGPEAIRAVGDALGRAFLEGTAVGATEMVAQSAEQGHQISLSWLGGPDEQ